MRLHDRVGDREPEPRSLTRLLGGEKRREQVGQHIVADPRSGVGHLHPHAVVEPARQVDGARAPRRVLAHGLRRVVEQVQEHLLQRVPVSQHGGERGQVLLDRDVLERQVVAHEQQGPLDHVVQVHRYLLRGALARERQEVAHDAPRAIGCSWITRRWPRSLVGSSFCSSRNSDRPAIDVSGLLSSWATPDTSCPTAASFSLWIRCDSRACWSVTSSTSTTTLWSYAGAGMCAVVTRIVRFSVVERSTMGWIRSPARAAASRSRTDGDEPTSAVARSRPMTSAIGAPSISARERFARRTRPASSTTAMPSLNESNAVSHCSLARRTISKNRALAITMAACVATVDSRRTSSGANTPPRGLAITSVPTTSPCARSGTAPADLASTPSTSRVGSPPSPGLRTSSSRSRPSERATSPGSSVLIRRPASGASVPSAAVTRSDGRPPSNPPVVPSLSGVSATSAPCASRNRIA